MKDFVVDKFYYYSGPNFYLDRQSMVFNLFLDPDGPSVGFYKDRLLSKFPEFTDNYPDKVADLFTKVIMLVSKMEMNLFIDNYNISRDGDEYVIAFECLDNYLAEEIVYFVRDWFLALNDQDDSFDFKGEFERLQKIFDKTIYGGPTIYALVEGGIKRKIPVKYLFEENQFQWGFGKKQIRGRSTVLHIDGIKDTEFTSYKDMVGEWLEVCGFPTPKGVNCFDEEEIVEEALKIGFPVVVKPVAGHKGIGVTTGIESEEEVRKAFLNIKKTAEEQGTTFEGALVQQQIYGYDHRILCIGGKYAACLKRVPAFVVGNGTDTIRELIRVENEKEVRLDTARSPLTKIKIDENLIDFLALRNMTLENIPAAGEEVVLRRVANISAGGVSINVTNEIHQKNIEMAENIAKFLNVTALGIDVLAQDITKPWTDGNFGIIEINAGPGVFMHLAPAEGGSVDVPGILMEYLFGKNSTGSRIPIINGNNISDKLIDNIFTELKMIDEHIEFGCLTKDGIFFNKCFFTNNKKHDVNCKMLLRNPKLDFAVINHTKDDIYDFGMWHEGNDITILDNAHPAEYSMMRDILPGGILIEIKNAENEGESDNFEMVISKDMHEIQRLEISDINEKDSLIFNAIAPYLSELIEKYKYSNCCCC